MEYKVRYFKDEEDYQTFIKQIQNQLEVPNFLLQPRCPKCNFILVKVNHKLKCAKCNISYVPKKILDNLFRTWNLSERSVSRKGTRLTRGNSLILKMLKEDKSKRSRDWYFLNKDNRLLQTEQWWNKNRIRMILERQAKRELPGARDHDLRLLREYRFNNREMYLVQHRIDRWRAEQKKLALGELRRIQLRF